MPHSGKTANSSLMNRNSAGLVLISVWGMTLATWYRTRRYRPVCSGGRRLWQSGWGWAARGARDSTRAFVDNPTYFPPDVQANTRFRERLGREIALCRLVDAREGAVFAAHLCSDAADCFVAQVFPVCGGWVTRWRWCG